MRDFFIRSLEMVINVYVAIAALAILVGAFAALFGNMPEVHPVLGFFSILIGGGISLILMAGFLYLGLGIYQNTRRMADLLERRP